MLMYVSTYVLLRRLHYTFCFNAKVCVTVTAFAVTAYLLTEWKTYIHQVATYLRRETIRVRNTSLRLKIGGPEKDLKIGVVIIYLELVYLVTALVPSETACLASSPGRRSLTAVWISREVMVERLL